MQSMCYCQNKTVIKQLLNGFQQQRVNILFNQHGCHQDGLCRSSIEMFLVLGCMTYICESIFAQQVSEYMDMLLIYFQKNVDREYGAIRHLNNSPFETIDQ